MLGIERMLDWVESTVKELYEESSEDFGLFASEAIKSLAWLIGSIAKKRD